MIRLERAAFDYTSCYCEENVLRLVERPELKGVTKCVVIITNSRRTVAVWEQRAAPKRRPIVWDYHVIMVAQLDGAPRVLDLDSRLPLGVALDEYVERALVPSQKLDPELVPRFRIVEGDLFAARLWSDRSHMKRADGSYRMPPPAWPPPRPEEAAVPLDEWLDPANESAPGLVVPIDALIEATRRALGLGSRPGYA